MRNSHLLSGQEDAVSGRSVVPNEPRQNLPRLYLWPILAAGLMLIMAGCGGIGPSTPETPTAAVVVVDAVDADTNKPLTVNADAVAGGVRGTITVTEGSVVLRNVPFGTGTPPVQPVTVTAPGYVTFAEMVQISQTVATFTTAVMSKANLAQTGTVRGTVTDQSGNPITSALVKFTQIGTSTTTEVKGYTDKAGTYVIGGIPSGMNTVSAEAQGFLTASQRVTVTPDASGTNPALNFTLLPGTTRLNVSGTVVDAFSQKPLAGAIVQFNEQATATTGSQGQFAINDLLSGTYTVTVSLTGYDQLVLNVDVVPGMSSLRFAMTQIALQPPGGPYNLAGKVTLSGAADNSGAVVTAVDQVSAREMSRVTTPASGEYAMFLPSGTYRLTVTYGSKSVGRTVTILGGGRVLQGIDFVLTLPAP